ncbi:carboxypeptidase-like regulatory domain-containing protein [Isosphaeraceae bacterium EP7]
MARRLLFRPLAGAACSLAVLAGCGEDGPTLVPVRGTVTLNGQPLADAEIVFVPDPANTDVTGGRDKSGPDGNYLATYNGRSGLAVGRYKVLVSKKAEAPPGMVLPDAIKMDRVQQEMMGIRKEILPSKYSSATKSDFAADIKEQGGVFDFDVKAPASKVASKK